MTETTMAAPLSGEEILEAVADELKKQMRRDCHLNAALAYSAFEAEIHLRLKLKDQGREPGVDARVTVRGGGSHGRPSEVRELVAEEALMESRSVIEEGPPNLIRQRAGMPIPTVTEDARGKKDIRGVKYAKLSDKAPRPVDPAAEPAEKPSYRHHPHPPGTPEDEKHEKQRQEPEEREHPK